MSSSRDPRWAAPAGPPAIVIPPLSSIERSDVEATRVVGTLDSPSHAVIAVLVGVAGVLEGEIYRVRDGENRIGRLQGLEISLPQKDDQISREHAILIHREGAFGIKLLKASNPMRVNGDVVTDGAALSDGDEISIGRSTFRLRVV